MVLAESCITLIFRLRCVDVLVEKLEVVKQDCIHIKYSWKTAAGK